MIHPTLHRYASILLGFALALSAWPAHADTPPGILVVVQAMDDLVSLDPAEGFELSSEQLFGSIYQRLVQADPDDPSVLKPVLAASWVVGSDDRSVTFTLRPNATFANGDPVTADDVIYSLSRAVKLNRSPAFILNELGWNADNVDASLIAVDAQHVRISWPASVSTNFALHILTTTVASIVDKRDVLAHQQNDDQGNRWLRAHSSGSGPFSIRRYVPREALVLDANPRSPGGGPRIKTLIIRNIADAATRRLLLEVGDADIARDLGPDQFTALKGKPGIRIAQFPSATVCYLLFNTTDTSNPALANPALWEAARWLVDYHGLAEGLLQGQFSVHQAFLADGFPGALDDTPYHFDPARARAILAKAGLDHGIDITLDVFNEEPFIDIAQSLQSSFAQAGVRLHLRIEAGAQVYTRLRARTYQAAWLYWIPDYFDAHSTASAFASNPDNGSHTLAWRAGWSMPTLTAETQKAVMISDPAERVRLYQDIQRQVQRESPFVISLQERSQLAMRSNVQGYRQGLDADMVYYDQVTK
ncbi:ABC transporter substrate-binding protein [Dyella caseinilytica]|uniref:ABC transporter substrate-binding protein n=2 Tax=Dyella caseinilytica TaxID=1849581 RepID=A0ABX7H380_9GAMM|nr:ABC transporter substrate-binding protein [Dyella caseinilytica]